MFDSKRFEKLLNEAVAFHGHLCSGQIMGVRMAMLGLDQIGISDPYGIDQKKMIVFVEIARCAADAIMSVTGCRVGKRSFKFIDTGKLAATFYHMQTHEAVRIAARPEILPMAAACYPQVSPHEAEKRFYRERSDSELFTINAVHIMPLHEEDTPGVPATTVCCTVCGERIYDQRHLTREGKTLCRTCAEVQAPYYQMVTEVLS